MKKMTNTLSALTIAAALMMNLTACTNDDNFVDTPEQPEVTNPAAVSTVHVTVGAGIGDATTRSAVDYDNGLRQRTLKFTDGDKLFVYACVTTDYNYFLAGTLSIVASSIDADGKTASFSGDLKVYHFESGTPVPSSYPFTHADPLNECSDHRADLIAKDMVDGCYTIVNYWNYQHDYTKSIAVDGPDGPSDDCVSTLMKTALRVRSYRSYKTEYEGDGGPKMFREFVGSPILDCTISGLTDGTAYTVTLLGDLGVSDYNSHSGSDYNATFDTTVTPTGGTARFAISLESGDASRNLYWSLKFVGGGQTRYVMLGQKSMGMNKVYNVTREATE